MVAGPVMPVAVGIRKGTKVSIPLVTLNFLVSQFLFDLRLVYNYLQPTVATLLVHILNWKFRVNLLCR